MLTHHKKALISLAASTLISTSPVLAMSPQNNPANQRLLAACASSQHNLAAIKRPLNAGANPNTTVTRALNLSPNSQRITSNAEIIGYAPLHLVTMHNHVQAVPILLHAKANVDATTNAKETALHFAARLGLHDITQLLLEQNASVSIRTIKNYTPLHEAAAQGHTQIAALLLKHNASLDQEKRASETALHLACLNGHYDVASLLISQNALVNAEDIRRHTPLSNAIQARNPHIVKLLLDSGATPPTPGSIAAKEIEKLLAQLPQSPSPAAESPLQEVDVYLEANSMTTSDDEKAPKD